MAGGDILGGVTGLVWEGDYSFYSIKWLKLVCINANYVFLKVDIMNNINFFIGERHSSVIPDCSEILDS